MKNMQLSKPESEALANPKPGDGPRYPWGLQLHLNAETLEKLGITGVPMVGEMLIVHARARVVSVSVRDEIDGDKQRNCELQITELALVSELAGDAGSKLYGAGDGR